MSAETAVKAFKSLESQDFRILQVIEAAMAKHEFVPKEVIIKYSKFNMEEATFRLEKLQKFRLIRQTKQPYLGYALNYSGYDCLAINAFLKAEIVEAFGKPLGVGKEADVYDALTPKGERIAIKFHRLGRISFRQTMRKRGYTTERTSWLLQSRKAAEKEYEALKLVYPKGVAVPKPISQNRHAIAMGAIEGAELAEWKEVSQPEKVLKEILRNIRKTYLKAEIIHADLSEYNIILKPDNHILIIDWPQYVTKNHPNAQQLLRRDVENIITFFKRKHLLEAKTDRAIAYVAGKGKISTIF
ncbi:MAG: RIO1 family regulatory kinase/ATPase [Candidatus Bathyarchaeota archaeon]|jgi:RIO kinase 2|nr:serine/threonine protein kinase [Candidatus Bathyarchaeota archaeon A05DMB-3]MDH7607442.1 RIO1 family regulatory kinase/ATPase [Candidatus Bathyarchaeota archaeon]